jgi:hypothetical protein
MTQRWSPAAASAAAYVALTGLFGRDVLANLRGAIAGDEGDPLFVAGILHWNAAMVPFTDAWWQFPIFAPTRDALAFSEHFLGLTPIASPIGWVARDAVVTYNLVTLLTFPLCALAMFALVRWLTSSAGAAFLAGLAFAFAPYRISHLPHLQLLAFFWAPLALLGLHAYLATGRRRWLALYGAAWMLQGAANGYALVFLSVFVGLWILWFVVARGNIAALAAIAIATAIAALPLVPIAARYMSVHALHGFERDIGEMRTYSADLAAVLCAPAQLSAWGWLRVGCRPEGELFPGIAGIVACALVVLRLRSDSTPRALARAVTLASRLLVAAGVAAGVVALTVWVAGPWRFALGPLSISASSLPKPVMLATVALVLGLVLSPGIRAAARRSSTAGFYLMAAVLTWVLALGPTVIFMGEPRGFRAPFAVLTSVPGISALRVPARFWLLTAMCLAVLVGFAAAPLLEGRRRRSAAVVLAIAAVLIAADGAVARMPAAPLPARPPDERALQGATVLTLPIDSLPDIASGFHAATGGWRSVNGYSGYFPAYYAALADASRDQDEDALAPFLARGDLHVMVAAGADGLRKMIERQPGAAITAASSGAVQYRIPGAGPASNGSWARGERVRIEAVRATCAASRAADVLDGDERTHWECGPQKPGQELVVDLGRPVSLGAVVQNLGRAHAGYPRRLRVDTSLDGTSWEAAWEGGVRGLLIAQALEHPGPAIHLAIPLPSREARYVRLTQLAEDQTRSWSVAEVEAWGR